MQTGPPQSTLEPELSRLPMSHQYSRLGRDRSSARRSDRRRHPAKGLQSPRHCESAQTVTAASDYRNHCWARRMPLQSSYAARSDSFPFSVRRRVAVAAARTPASQCCGGLRQTPIGPMLRCQRPRFWSASIQPIKICFPLSSLPSIPLPKARWFALVTMLHRAARSNSTVGDRAGKSLYLGYCRRFTVDEQPHRLVLLRDICRVLQ